MKTASLAVLVVEKLHDAAEELEAKLDHLFEQAVKYSPPVSPAGPSKSRRGNSAAFLRYERNDGGRVNLALRRFVQMIEFGMSHWRKRNPTAVQFNSSLVRWSMGAFVVFGTLVALSLRGHV